MNKVMVSLLCLSVAAQSVSSREVTLTARPASVLVEPCKRKQSDQFEVLVQQSVRVENKSHQTVLMPRSGLVVDGVRVAESARDATEGRFLFVIEPEFFSAGGNTPSPPALHEFVVLRSGEGYQFTLDRTLEGTMDPNIANGHVLHSGHTYWIQFRFWTLPEYFYWKGNRAFKRFRKKWEGTGLLLNQEVWTEPISFALALDSSRTCG